MAGIWSDLFGTTKAFFRIGRTGPRLKDDSGVLAVRNAADSADANLSTALLKNTGNSIEINSDAANTGTDRKLTLSVNPAASAALEVQFPPAKGTDGYYVRQKSGTASGVLEFELVAPPAGSAASLLAETTTLGFGSSSPVTMFQKSSTAVIDRIQFVIDTAFDGTPSVTVGIAGQTSKYSTSAEVDLTAAAGTVFEVHPGIAAVGSAEDLIATYSAGGATAGSARIIVYYADAPT